MKDLLKQALRKVHDFVNGHEDSIPEKSDPLIARLEKALAQKKAVHIIFAESSFTGDIIKYDTDRQQIIVKNFAKNVSRIIRVSDIRRVTFVPLLSKRPKKEDLRKSEMLLSSHSFYLSEFVQNEGEQRCGRHNHFSPNHVANDKRYSVLRL